MENHEKEYDYIERISFFLGIFILITLIGYLGYQLSTTSNSPPRFHTNIQYDPSISGYTYKIGIKNSGEQTGEAVHAEVALYQNGVSVGRTSVEFKYIPAKSEKTAWITFYTKKQAKDSLKLISLSFIEP